LRVHRRTPRGHRRNIAVRCVSLYLILLLLLLLGAAAPAACRPARTSTAAASATGHPLEHLCLLQQWEVASRRLHVEQAAQRYFALHAAGKKRSH